LDPDTIEDTNLNRLVGARFAAIEQKTSKVLIAKRIIESVNPQAKIVMAASDWEQQALALQDCEVIFGCVDSLICRSELESFARRYLIPLIDIGMDVHGSEGAYAITGQVALSMPGRACLKCVGTTTAPAFGGRSTEIWQRRIEAAGHLAQCNSGFYRGWLLHADDDALVQEGRVHTTA
jgi:molybdopterin/thiamine biosynthesis adenylyltransferase